jgi:hypothetical protein
MPPGSREHLDGLLTGFDLSHRADAHPEKLSQGERSRLAVARALASRAAVLIMDEPLVHVDPARAAGYWELIRQHLAQTRASLIFSTHSARTALMEASSLICLKDGRVLAEGETRELYENPLKREVAESLGDCNWLEPDEAGFWLGRESAEPLCFRPERTEIVAAPQGPLVVKSARFGGSVAEAELLHEPTGKVRKFFHRPAAAKLAPGQRVGLRVLVLCLLVIFLAGCSDPEAPLPVAHVGYWPSPPDKSRLPAPRSVAVGNDDQVIVLDNGGRVLVYDPRGKLVKQWFMPEFSVGKPEGVEQLHDGRIVVCDTHYHRLVFFDQDGKVLSMCGQRGTGPGEFEYPVGVCEDAAGNIYVAEYGGNDRVQKFDSQGKHLATIGSVGTGDGQFQRPSGLTWHEGKLYVADAANNRVQVFTDGGRFLNVLDDADHPLDLQMPYDVRVGADGMIYVIEYKAGRLTRATLEGKLTGRFGTQGHGANQFSTPWGMAIDSKLRVRVADTGNRRIVELRL